MTAHTVQEINLTCDQCNREMPGGHRPNVSEVRKSARNFGWCHVAYVDQHYDFCGECIIEALVKPGKSVKSPEGSTTSDPVAAIHTAIDDEYRRIDRVERGGGPFGLLGDGVIADAHYAIRALNRALALAGQPVHRAVE